MTPIPSPETVDLVIYHAACNDGFTAAWAAWKVVGDRAEFHKRQYGEDPPDVRGKNVAIVDFSFPRKVLEQMAKDANSLVVLDHHRSAKKDLGPSTRVYGIIGDEEFDTTIKEEAAALIQAIHGSKEKAQALRVEVRELEAFPNAIFDMDKAGALLAWEWFHPGKPVPSIVQHANDRDLWKFNMPETRAVIAGLSIIKFEFDDWDNAHHILETPNARPEFLQSGRIVLKHIDVECNSIAKKARLIEFEGVRMWATNYTGRYNSDVAQVLREYETEEGNGDVPGVSLTWFYDQDNDVYRCSLRSRDDRADVSQIAEKFGGGGHRNAAGFEWAGDIREIVRVR